MLPYNPSIEILLATRQSTLVFCVNIAHVIALTQAFRNRGVDARYVYSKTPVSERKALIESFKSGQFPVLINCGQSHIHFTIVVGSENVE